MTPSEFGARDVAALVESELARIDDSLVRASLAVQLVAPERHMRDWDYSTTDERFPCWTVLKHEDSDTGIVYSQHGHGPGSPWGLVSLSSMGFGMDCGWFLRLEDAFVDSHAGSSLRIWNLIGPKGELVSKDRTLTEAFALRDRIDAGLPRPVHHVVYRGREDGVR